MTDRPNNKPTNLQTGSLGSYTSKKEWFDTLTRTGGEGRRERGEVKGVRGLKKDLLKSYYFECKARVEGGAEGLLANLH